jgi:hypothetical protein
VLAQIGLKQGHLLSGRNRVQGMADLFGRSSVGDLHHCGLDQYLIGDLADLGGHGRGKEQILPFGRQFGHDAAQIGQKAHVEHAVGLVENQGAHMGQIHQTPVDEVEQPSGARHQNAYLACGLDLRGFAHSAEYGGGPDAGLLAKGNEGLMNLQGEFAGGRKDKHAHRAAHGNPVIDHALQRGNAKAAVLPVPVWARPRTSLPASTGGMA